MNVALVIAAIVVLPLLSMWDDEAGYDLDDPKHPTFADRYADWADQERKRRKEDALFADEPPQDRMQVDGEDL